MYTLGDDIEMEGSTVPLNFNSTKYAGVCKPSDVRTLSRFRDLQSQLNRVAQVKGLTKIAVDGDIGPATIKLMTSAGMVPAGTGCSTIAAGAVAFTGLAKTIADAGGAPANVAGPIAKPSTLVSATGQETLAPASPYGGSLLESFNALSTPMKIAAVGVAGGLGYYLYKSTKKKRKG